MFIVVIPRDYGASGGCPVSPILFLFDGICCCHAALPLLAIAGYDSSRRLARQQHLLVKRGTYWRDRTLKGSKSMFIKMNIARPFAGVMSNILKLHVRLV
jgi:hypothetical protein